MHGTSFRQTNIYLNKKDKSRQPPVVEAVGSETFATWIQQGPFLLHIPLQHPLDGLRVEIRDLKLLLELLDLLLDELLGNLLFQITNSYIFAQAIKHSVLLPAPIAETYRMFILAQLFHVFSYLRLAKVNKIFNAANFYIEKHRSASYNLKTSFPKAQR